MAVALVIAILVIGIVAVGFRPDPSVIPVCGAGSTTSGDGTIHCVKRIDPGTN